MRELLTYTFVMKEKLAEFQQEVIEVHRVGLALAISIELGNALDDGTELHEARVLRFDDIAHGTTRVLGVADHGMDFRGRRKASRRRIDVERLDTNLDETLGILPWSRIVKLFVYPS